MTKNGYPVKIRVYFNRKYKYLPLHIYQHSLQLVHTTEIKKRDFELSQQLDFCKKNNLTETESIKIISEGIDTKTQLKVVEDRIDVAKQEARVTLNDFISIYVEERKALGKSFKHIIEARNQILKFTEDGEVFINDINYEFLNAFIVFKKKQGTGDQGISFYLRSLRTVFLEAQRRDSLNIKGGNPFKGLIKQGRKKEIPDITPMELKSLFNFVPKKSTNKANTFRSYRNIAIFMFQLVIGGHDYADIAHLEWSNIRRGRIRFQRYKNRNHPGGGPIIDNLLCPFAVATMEKYGDKSSKRIFGFIPIDSRYTHHRGNVNRSLSTITKSVGLKVKLTSKTPRYLFRTYAGELGVDTLTIMQLQGHTPQGVTFGYQRSLPYKIIDQGLGKVLDKLFSS